MGKWEYSNISLSSTFYVCLQYQWQMLPGKWTKQFAFNVILYLSIFSGVVCYTNKRGLLLASVYCGNTYICNQYTIHYSKFISRINRVNVLFISSFFSCCNNSICHAAYLVSLRNDGLGLGWSDGGFSGGVICITLEPIRLFWVGGPDLTKTLRESM